MARVQSIVKKNAYCCPNCDYEIFSSLGHFHHHDIKIEAGTITTPIGSGYLTHGRQQIVMALLEAYPKPITRNAMIAYYEFYLEKQQHKESEDPGQSIDVQMVFIRRTLRPLGISIQTIWGNGWRIQLDFKTKEKPLVSQST